LCCSFTLAAEPNCSEYSEFGLDLGMTHKQVRQTIGKRGESAGQTRNKDGYRSIERYEQGTTQILVHYDGAVGKKSSARVVSLETTFEENVIDVPELMDMLRARLGQPSTGAANLDNGLEDGPVEWADPACDVRVTLFRRTASWWEPNENAEFHVKIDSLSFIQTGEFRGEPVRAAGVSETSRIE